MTWEKRVLPARRGRRVLQEKGDEKEMPICGGLPPGGIGPLLPLCGTLPKGEGGPGGGGWKKNNERRKL